MHEAPVECCCFYRRFVDFKIILLRSANDSLFYQSANSPDIYCIRDIFAHHYGAIGLNTEQYLTELFCMRRLFDAYFQEAEKTNHELIIGHGNTESRITIALSDEMFTHSFGLEHITSIESNVNKRNSLRIALFKELLTTGRPISNMSVEDQQSITAPIAASYNPLTQKPCTIEERLTALLSFSDFMQNLHTAQAQYRDMGLYIGHAYSLLGCITFDNKKYIVIRNPHGSNLPTMKNNSKIYQKNWGYSFGAPIDGGFHNWYSVYRYLNGTADPLTSRGLFLMEVDEFKRVFTTIEYYTGSTFENYL